MRILLINPNTTIAITDRVAGYVRTIASGDAEFVPVTGRFGARYIASRAASAIAAHAALDALAEHGAGCDGVYLCCFGDPGLLALKELSPVPVIGMAEAACLAACSIGFRFSIVTGGQCWKAMIEEFVTAQGLIDRLASVRTVAPTGGEIARDPDAALASLAAACEACALQDGADVVILGGAALAGLAGRISSSVPVPVLCSVEAGVRAVIAAARLGSMTATSASRAAIPRTETIGLSARLTAAMDLASV